MACLASAGTERAVDAGLKASGMASWTPAENSASSGRGWRRGGGPARAALTRRFAGVASGLLGGVLFERYRLTLLEVTLMVGTAALLAAYRWPGA